LASGSVTASVSPDLGFVVISPNSGSTFTGSLNITGSVSASIFRGDGSGLFNISISNLALDSSKIFTGSVTASVHADGYFRVFDATGSVASEFSGSLYVSESAYARFFVGDGSQLTNVQAAAAPLIASASVTASVADGQRFIVKSAASGSQFTGSINVSGSISASLFRGDGSALFNIPLDALEGLQLDRIQSGSSTAIISNQLLVNVPVSSSLFRGDGSGLFNIPLSSLENLQLSKINSGSFQAEISPNKGLQVNTSASIAGNLNVTGGLFVTGGNIVAATGSGFVGDGSGLTNITIANLAFETALL
jgi:hypothetical protein